MLRISTFKSFQIMDSVIDVIRNATFIEQKAYASDSDNENELRHPFIHVENSFDCDETEEIELSDAHVRTTSELCNKLDDRWSSLDDLFNNLVVRDFPSELSSNVKSHLKEMLLKPDLNIKIRESLSRKFSSSSSGKKFKPEWKTNIIKGERDAKTERKLSLLFSSQRKRSSINENIRKKIEENILLKVGSKRNTLDKAEDRKCSTDGKPKKKCDESGTTSRKQSSVSQKLENRTSKKLEMDVNEFLLTSPHYNLFKNVNDQQISKNSIPWSLKERTRKKVTNWLNK